MGNFLSESYPQTNCLGIHADQVISFPSHPSPWEANTLLAAPALDLQSNIVSFRFGTVLLALLMYHLDSVDLTEDGGKGVGISLWGEGKLPYKDMLKYNDMIEELRSSLGLLNQIKISDMDTLPALNDTIRGGKELFDFARDSNHFIRKNPVVGMPIFIKLTNIFWATLELSSKLDPALQQGSNAVIQKIPDQITDFVKDFFIKRFEATRRLDCCRGTGLQPGNGETNCIVDDAPWANAPGRLHADCEIYGDHGNENCRSVITFVDSDRTTFLTIEKFKRDARDKYCEYFQKVFPVQFDCS